MTIHELKNDPLREKLINILSIFSKNKYTVTVILLILVGIVSFAIINVKPDNSPDYSLCFDLNDGRSDLEGYCNKENIKSILDDIKNNKISNNQSLLFFLTNFNNMDNQEKLSKLKTLNFNDIQIQDLKSMLYRVYADIPLDNKEYTSSIENYKIADELFNNQRTYSALINYKIARAYFDNNQDIENAKKYISKALLCEYAENTGPNPLADKIEFLKAQIQHIEKK